MTATHGEGLVSEVDWHIALEINGGDEEISWGVV